MYTRVVVIISKLGKARELCNAIEQRIVPILKKQTGFVDEMVGLGTGSSVSRRH